jgi:hypothetical protein
MERMTGLNESQLWQLINWSQNFTLSSQHCGQKVYNCYSLQWFYLLIQTSVYYHFIYFFIQALYNSTWKTYVKREDNIKMNLRGIRWEGVDWIQLAQDTDQLMCSTLQV